MKPNYLTIALSQALSCAVLICANAPTHAQTAPDGASAADASGDPKQLDAIVVQGQIAYRNRTDNIAPTLSYDLEYFQRFEPLTVGDMLKRVPSVSFVSDVLEYDGARLRGLDPGYTQILINGKKVPGAGNDRSFFVDRIPAELVERIEIVRSPSANRSGDAVAGALNIVLRDAYEFDGAYLRAGGMRFNDGEYKNTYGAFASGEAGGGRLLGGFNVQGRYNPKLKRSDRFQTPNGSFVNREDQTDTRDGTDYSGNLSYTRELGHGQLSLDGFYVRTERSEREHSLEYNHPSGKSRNQLLSENHQNVIIRQNSGSLGAAYDWDMAGGRSVLELGYARFNDNSQDNEEEDSYSSKTTPPAFLDRQGQRTYTRVRDSELSFKLAHKRDIATDTRMEFGADYQNKQRNAALRTSTVQVTQQNIPLPAYVNYQYQASRLEERRLDPYLMFSGTADALAWEAGLRYETTRSQITANGPRSGKNYAQLLPSFHLKWDLSPADRLSFSLARTLRRPNFDQLLPITQRKEYGDNDFIGNPRLNPETAWGLDLGVEHRLGKRGVIGLNLFYRQIKDLIEIVNTGTPSITAYNNFQKQVKKFLSQYPGATPATPGYPQFHPDSFAYSADNIGSGSGSGSGSGKVYGIELDLSSPLTALGLPNTGVFFNYSWLNSKITDDFGRRRFNNQAKYVYNLGFIHDIVPWAASFGASYRNQGDAYSRLLGEEVTTSYGADLEVFVEKRFGDKISVRLTGSNLLDADKDEIFHKFNTAPDQFSRIYDEYELERENAGPVYQVIMRYSF